MGAEQSALSASTQTGQPEATLELVNSKLFFSNYFDKMPKPKTGPVTQALLRLVENMPKGGETFLQDEAAPQANISPGKNGENDGSESDFDLDSIAAIDFYDGRLELEPLQIVEFESMDDYDLVVEPVEPCPLQDVLPIFDFDVEDF
ncbi:uncharacterized protein LOC117902044 [Drosophila subobscura]|uniref:uncharacterized protein LOC117902044 n=1 Tax=Drosophila subobscura TaxID=7241 RepID=UPI00155A2008|nr:uncharacterized protein LOC117902044 [Drosophila subobscura]